MHLQRMWKHSITWLKRVQWAGFTVLIGIVLFRSFIVDPSLKAHSHCCEENRDCRGKKWWHNLFEFSRRTWGFKPKTWKPSQSCWQLDCWFSHLHGSDVRASPPPSKTFGRRLSKAILWTQEWLTDPLLLRNLTATSSSVTTKSGAPCFLDNIRCSLPKCSVIGCIWLGLPPTFLMPSENHSTLCGPVRSPSQVPSPEPLGPSSPASPVNLLSLSSTAGEHLVIFGQLTLIDYMKAKVISPYHL